MKAENFSVYSEWNGGGGQDTTMKDNPGACFSLNGKERKRIFTLR